jgi:hypothetical protein
MGRKKVRPPVDARAVRISESDVVRTKAQMEKELVVALEIMTQVAAGLAAVHEQNLVHRDIKPSNIMVRLKDDGSITAKIIDLGLAKSLNEPGAQTAISAAGAFAGTPEFASPEQFAGVPVDIRSGNSTEGIAWVEDGIRDYRAIGAMVGLPFRLGMKAEALHLADRTSEALDAINEAEALAERFENRYWSAELNWLRGMFLVATGAEETQIEASFQQAIRIAKEQKSVSLQRRAEATYAEYRRQKASGSAGRGFRLPL